MRACGEPSTCVCFQFVFDLDLSMLCIAPSFLFFFSLFFSQTRKFVLFFFGSRHDHEKIIQFFSYVLIPLSSRQQYAGRRIGWGSVRYTYDIDVSPSSLYSSFFFPLRTCRCNFLSFSLLIRLSGIGFNT